MVDPISGKIFFVDQMLVQNNENRTFITSAASMARVNGRDDTIH